MVASNKIQKPFSIKFNSNSELIWFFFIKNKEKTNTPDVFQTKHHPGIGFQVDKIIKIPYESKTSWDFTSEYRIENDGYYARWFETKDPNTKLFITENKIDFSEYKEPELVIDYIQEELDDLNETLQSLDPEFLEWLEKRHEETKKIQLSE